MKDSLLAQKKRMKKCWINMTAVPISNTGPDKI